MISWLAAILLHHVRVLTSHGAPFCPAPRTAPLTNLGTSGGGFARCGHRQGIGIGHFYKPARDNSYTPRDAVPPGLSGFGPVHRGSDIIPGAAVCSWVVPEGDLEVADVLCIASISRLGRCCRRRELDVRRAIKV